MATPMEFAASIAGIGDVSVKILRLLYHIYDDTHGIRSSLKHLNQSIESLRTVLEEFERNAAAPNLGPKQRQLLCIASTTAHKCTQLLDQLQTETPALRDNASLGRRAYATVLKSINNASIQEKQKQIDMYMHSLNISLLVFHGLSIEAVGENVARLLSQLNFTNTTPADVTESNDIDEYSRRGRMLVDAYQEDIRKEGGSGFISGIRAELPDKISQDVDKLASQGRFLQAAKNIRNIIDIHEELSPGQENDSKEVKLLKERRVDLLLQCSTVWCHREALSILEDLVQQATKDEERAILYWKMGRLHAVPELLGNSGCPRLGAEYLDAAITDLQRLSPFPHEILCSATQLLVQVFKDIGDSWMVKGTEQKIRNMFAEASGHIDEKDVPEVPRSAALDWCGMKGYPVKSERFRYFDPANDELIEGNIKRRGLLHIAARDGKEEVVKEMLAEMEDNVVDVQDSSGSTPLMEAAKACHLATVNTLLAHGASANRADNEGRTALHWAADQDRRTVDGPAVVSALLARGTPELVDRRDSARDETALYLACIRYHHATVKRLLAHNANPNLTNRQLQSPLLKTIGESDRHAVKRRGIALDIARALLAAGADPNVRDVYDNTALTIACLRGDVDAVDLLLGHCAASIPPRHSLSSSSLSVASGFVPTYTTATTTTTTTTATTARPLIPTDVNQRGKRGETPLIIAVDHLHKVIVKKLRDYDANPAEADQRHQTAWDHAKTVGAPGELLSLLAMKSRASSTSAERRRSSILSRLFKSDTN